MILTDLTRNYIIMERVLGKEEVENKQTAYNKLLPIIIESIVSKLGDI